MEQKFDESSVEMQLQLSVMENIQTLSDQLKTIDNRCCKLESQNETILHKLKQVNEYILRKPQNYAEVLCMLSENMQAMRSMKDEFNKTLKSIFVKKIKPSEYQAIQPRINLSNFHPGIIPALDDNFNTRYTIARDRGKIETFTGKEICDITKLDKKRDIICPDMFSYFLYLFLSNPQNCAFIKKGDRYYVCQSDNDNWSQIDTPEFWELIREFLWESYVSYIEQLKPEDFSQIVIDRLATITSIEIPLNKTALSWLLFTRKYMPGQKTNKQRLTDAYLSRNKSSLVNDAS